MVSMAEGSPRLLVPELARISWPILLMSIGLTVHVLNLEVFMTVFPGKIMCSPLALMVLVNPILPFLPWPIAQDRLLVSPILR